MSQTQADKILPLLCPVKALGCFKMPVREMPLPAGSHA